MGIAKPAIAAAQQNPALTDTSHVGEQCLAVLAEDLRADRHA
jgi:hypothetical protein